ncbi:unnamed protein product [Ilex paraguariensis]|uniref:Phytosulfokine n=1 Tax=Ilex paraguariensis TaxID=185542 RepID=A0ABC8QY56_9AQUA
MSKLSTLFMVALLLFFTLPCAGLPEPFLVKTQLEDGTAENIEVGESSCEGEEEEECLMRRTLAAHVDYIYTQKRKP